MLYCSMNNLRMTEARKDLVLKVLYVCISMLIFFVCVCVTVCQYVLFVLFVCVEVCMLMCLHVHCRRHLPKQCFLCFIVQSVHDWL